MDTKLVPISKLLSLVLRHKPDAIGLRLDSEGWVKIDALIAAANQHGRDLDFDILLRVVHENDKQRFAISEDGKSIRANQGHSIAVDLGLTPVEPPQLLYHGTVAEFLESIRSRGLVAGSRRHVHLSADFVTAEAVGRRRGHPLVLQIHANLMDCAGCRFFKSQNGVWLTDHVPVDFIVFPST